ncbi:MAG: hydrogenase expression/formation protein [Woeseiaceae bacterium]
MSVDQIPVHVVGPGSQPDTGQDLRYIDMPNDMATFSAPHIPDPQAVAHLAGAREAMRWLGHALSAYAIGDVPNIADLTRLDAESRELVSQILGEGEVSILSHAEVPARCQESVLAGVWRTLYFDEQDRVICDLLEVASSPHLVPAEADSDHWPAMDASGEAQEEFPNALPILVELRAHARSYPHDGQPHAINLTLLPLSEAEIGFVEQRLGRGPVEILSRGYGKCQVTSTATPNVWWVRFYNAMGTLILNTIEVVDIPEVVVAAEEDLRDSAQRLDEILAPYWQDEA